MNETDQSTGTAPGGETPEPKYHSFSEALDAARKDAACIARDAAPRLKQAIQGAAHDMAYGAAFGACFAACFARELVPDGLRDAFRRGAEDGSNAGQQAGSEDAPAVEPPGLPA